MILKFFHPLLKLTSGGTEYSMLPVLFLLVSHSQTGGGVTLELRDGFSNYHFQAQ